MESIKQFYRFLRSTPSNSISLLLLFRTTSLLLTSFFYLLESQASLLFKVGVIISLGLAALITTNLHKKFIQKSTLLKLVVLTETVGLTLLLIPTGGLSSPFIFYALNPILVAASFLTPLFSWSVLSFYLGSASLIAIIRSSTNYRVLISEETSYFYVICIVITLLISLFTRLTSELHSKTENLKIQQKKLLLVNKKITVLNDKYHVTLKQIISLHHLMDNLTSTKNDEKLIKVLTSSIIKYEESDEAFFWLTDINQHHSYVATTTNNIELEYTLKKQWHSIRNKRASFIRTINNELYGIIVIRTSKNVGVFGIKISNTKEAREAFLKNRTFEFWAELSELMIDKIHKNLLNDQIIVVEEQNRIANVIHDSASQRLFGIAYSLHSLQVKSQTITNEELNEEFQFLLQSVNTTIKDLRTAVYRLSVSKKDKNPFIDRLKAYLDDYSRLNDIHIDFQLIGDETIISMELKEALYRIICEACGNAVRHGNCLTIKIRVFFSEEKTEIIIHDDGIGFSLEEYTSRQTKGIGLVNMKSIVNSFKGKFSIGGLKGLGTTIEIKIPNTTLSN